MAANVLTRALGRSHAIAMEMPAWKKDEPGGSFWLRGHVDPGATSHLMIKVMFTRLCGKVPGGSFEICESWVVTLVRSSAGTVRFEMLVASADLSMLIWSQGWRVMALLDETRGQVRLQRRHIAAATIGNALEFYDFFAYGLFAIQIGHAFFPSESAYLSLMGSLATFGAGFLTRPIGAIVIGRYADRAGRKPAMMLSFMLIGCSMLVMGLIPSFSTIGLAAPVLVIVARLVQGFSVGGEIGSNTAFLVEAAAPGRRGFIASFQGATQAGSVLVLSLLGFGLNAVLPVGLASVYAWRIVVLLGAAIVPFGLWLRRDMPETLNQPLPTPETPRVPFSYKRIAVLGTAVWGSITIAAYVSVYAVTFAQNSLHMSARAGFAAQLMSAALSIPSLVLCGLLSDRIGRKPIYVVGNLIFLLSIVPLFVWMTTARSDIALIAGMGLLGTTKSFILGPFTAGMSEALPQEVRAMAFGTVYSFAIAIFGGSTQLVITWLIHVSGSAMAPAWFLIVAVAIGQVALMLFPETAPIASDAARAAAERRA